MSCDGARAGSRTGSLFALDAQSRQDWNVAGLFQYQRLAVAPVVNTQACMALSGMAISHKSPGLSSPDEIDCLYLCHGTRPPPQAVSFRDPGLDRTDEGALCFSSSRRLVAT
ncbi:hypothetical protein BS50DRAFT_239944 [Corynespora cassiicola Philippines]|uniref:Uncharacterized protein n=1 Tax=Corynespora cassiicola Philippines TaxID=1448308 RepID=A0A2T2P3N5_CORCC|nr:hypothetical protein BS50DRAFT_239944 [Corynespora cassiicola Philippines]